VTNPEHVQQLVRTAADLAVLGSGSVRLVSVAVKDHRSPFGVFDDETIVAEFAAASHELVEDVEAPADVTVERQVVAARSAADGLESVVREANAAGLVVGWSGPAGRADAVLGTTADELVERVSCDLYVERVGREAAGVASILLPVAGGPHVPAAARVAAAIADRNGATVVVFSVDTGATDRSAFGFAAEGREAVLATPGVEPVLETRTVDAGNPTEAIVTEAAGHDVVVLGATRQGALRRRLMGSVPRRVVGRTDRTVILARNGDTVRGVAGRLGRLRRTWPLSRRSRG
jgi:nucleotide-binding universal stress UspA family protein